MRACSRLDDEATFEGTRWVTLLYLPIGPLDRARYRLVDRTWTFPATRRLRLEHLEALPLSAGQVARTYALAWVILPAALVTPTALLGLPGVFLGAPLLAAAGAVLSSLWMIPLAVGALVWTQGQPWPRRPPAGTWTAWTLELRRTAAPMAVASAITFALVGGSCGGLRVVLEVSQGLGLRDALRGGLENALFILVLCAVVLPGSWFSAAWRATHPR